MFDNLLSPQVPINMQMEPVTDKVDTSVSQIGLGTVGPVSNNPLPNHYEVMNQQNVSMDQSMSYIPGSESSTLTTKPGEQVGSTSNIGPQYIIVGDNEGDMDAIWDSLSPQNVSLPVKRKAVGEPSPSSYPRQQSSVPNKRVSQIQPSLSSPRMPESSALSKRSSDTQPLSNTTRLVNVPAKKLVRNESIPSKGGTQRLPTPKSRTAPAEPSPKGKAGSNEAVRSKMKETLAAALSMVSQPQEKDPNKEERSPPQPVNTRAETDVGSQSAPPIQADGISGSSLDTTVKEIAFADTGSLKIPAGMGKINEQETQYNYVLPDTDGSFNDSFFVKDELLQGNGLTWAWDMELVEEKDCQATEKLEEADVGKDKVEKVVYSPQDLASKIEAELFKLFGGVNKKYKEKGRSLMFNLKDRSNPELRERVMSGEISAERLCSMTPEELASEELSQWRMAKAEELAQMKVLPDSDGDVRRLVKKTHKGEYQVEVELDNGASVDVSAGSNSLTNFRPKTKEKEAYPSPEASEVKRKDGGVKTISENQDSTGRLTIPAEGTDPMQELILDECKDSELGPPRSFEEFIQDLAVDDPFAESVGQIESLSEKDNGNAENVDSSNDIVLSSPTPMDRLGTPAKKVDQTKIIPTELKVNVTNSESPVERKFSPIVSVPKGEQVWEGELQLTLTSLVKVVGIFRSGEKTSTKEWPGSFEIKGKVRPDAFEKFIQELPNSRSRAVMVIHFVLKKGFSEVDQSSFSEAVDSYVAEERLGFGEPIPGVEIYFCPPHPRIIESLSKHLLKDRTDILKSSNNSLIGVVVWRRPHLTSAISPNSHHKHSSKKHNFSSSRRNEDKNVNMNNTSRPPPPRNNVVDDDDDIPPGFGPGAAAGADDDLPEFNFSGNLSSPTPRTSSSSQGGQRLTPSQPRPLPSRPVDQMRELIHKYGGQSGNNDGGRNWKEDDDDIPEWQPQLPVVPPVNAYNHQQLLRPHVFNQTAVNFPGGQVVQPQNVIQPIIQVPLVNAVVQNGVRWVAPPGGGGGPQVNTGQYYGTQWRQDAPRSRGF